MPERVAFFELFRTGGVGSVTHKQNTFWHVEVSNRAASEPWCITLHVPTEARLPDPNRFASVGLLLSHPLLADFHEPWLNLYAARTRVDRSGVLSVIESAVAEATEGFRELAHYVDPTRAASLLRASGGLLLSAPESVATHVLSAVTTSGHPGLLESRPGIPAPGRRQLLRIGNGYLIARQFEIRRGYA